MAATKKITKQAAKKADEVKSIEQLRADLAAKTTDLLLSRRGNAAGELTNPRIITVTRKEIARLNFAIRAAEIKELKEVKS